MANERGADIPPEGTPPGSGNPSSPENQPNNPQNPRVTPEMFGQLDPQSQQELLDRFFNQPMQATPDEANADSTTPRRRRAPWEGRNIEEAQREQVRPVVENTFFFPPKADDNESYDDYEARKEEARQKYFSAEASAMRLEQVRKGAIYLVQTLEGARSEREIHWIIEDALRAGENDWVSPDTFQQACQSALQAIDTVFSADQSRRRKFAEMIRGRQAGYACEFYARFINGGELGKNITNFFQEYYQAMLNLPGVTEMMDMIEERDDKNEGTNLRGAYFRKLNFENNEGKKAEWYKYYKEEERNDKDKRWGVWVVDKKFQLYKKGLEDKSKFNSDYLDNFKDPQDEELVKVLLVKSHQNNNEPVDAIKKLHRVVFKELYEGQGVEIPKGYHLPQDVIDQLHENEKLKNAVRILTQDERDMRGALEEDKVTLSQSTGIPLDRMIYELNRSVILSQRIEHSFQFSTHWDNLRWKKEENMTPQEKKLFDQAMADLHHDDSRHLDEYGVNKKGEQIILNPVVSWAVKSDPRVKGTVDEDKKKKRSQLEKETDSHKRAVLEKELENLSGEARKVNLRIAGEKRAHLHKLKRQLKSLDESTDEHKKLKQEVELLETDYEIVAIDEMRGAKNHIFTMQWDKSYRNFYEKYWNLIDHENSFTGDSSREARKAQFFGRTLEQSGEAESAKRFMRRYADTGVKDIGKFFAFESGLDMVDQFGTVFNRVKRWSHVIQTADKLRGTLMQMLNDPALLADPVKFTTEIKKNYRPHMATDDTYDREYYTDEEYFLAAHSLENQLDYVTGQWAEAIIEYNKNHSWQQHSADLKQEVLIKNVASMVSHEIITPHTATHILDNQFGPYPKRVLYEITHVLLRPREGILGLLGELLEESGKAFAQGFKA